MEDRTKDYSVEPGEVPKIKVPYLGQVATFNSSVFGPNTYKEVGQVILRKGLRLPTDETAFLLHALYLGPEGFMNEETVNQARSSLGKLNGYLWTFRNRLYVPEGVYSVKDPRAEGLDRELDIGKLEDLLRDGKEITASGIKESKDGSVRFAPKSSYQLGIQTPQTLANQGDVIADYGVDGARLLAEAYGKINKTSILRIRRFTVKKGEDPILKVSALAFISGFARLGASLTFNEARSGIALGLVA